MAELFGKATGCSKGLGGSMHLFDAAKNFLGGYGIVGGHIPLAAGTAFASKYRGDGRVTLCFFGDGAVPQGAFHEGVALAALWKLPVVFICENNQYSMGTPLYRTLAVADVSQKALGYGIARDRFDGDDVLRVRDRIAEAVRRARNESLPTLVEIITYRFRGHSMSDAGHYRTKEEVEEWKKRDPIAYGARAARCGRRWTRRTIVAIEAEGRGGDRGGGEVRRREPRAGLRDASPSSRTRSNETDAADRSLSRGAQRGHGRGDGARRPHLPHGRGGRPLRRRLQGVEGDAREVRREARHRHADRRGRLRRRRHRRRDGRPAADHRVHDLELLARRGRSADQQRRQDPADVGRAVHAAGRVPRPGRRRRTCWPRSTASRPRRCGRTSRA